MSGLSMKIIVVARSYDALMRVRNYSYRGDSLNELLSPRDIRTYAKTHRAWYMEFPDRYAIDRSYETTMTLIAEALGNEGIALAKGFDDGSGEYGAAYYDGDQLYILDENGESWGNESLFEESKNKKAVLENEAEEEDEAFDINALATKFLREKLERMIEECDTEYVAKKKVVVKQCTPRNFPFQSYNLEALVEQLYAKKETTAEEKEALPQFPDWEPSNENAAYPDDWTRVPVEAPVLPKIDEDDSRYLSLMNQKEEFTYPIYFRGPDSQIRELMTLINKRLDYRKLDNGVSQVKIESLLEGAKLLQIIQRFPCLRCVGYEEIPNQGSVLTPWVFFSESGFGVISHIHEVPRDPEDLEGFWYIYYAQDNVLEADSYYDYSFPHRKEWYSDRYIMKEEDKYYQIWPTAGENVTLTGVDKKIPPDRYAHNTLMKKLVIPEGVTIIGARAFKNCTELTEVQLPKSLKTIEDRAFEGCSQLTDVKLPESLTKIGDYAFIGCKQLTTMHLPNSISKLGKGIFYDCNKLYEVRLPERLERLPPEMFYWCHGLEKVSLPETLTTIGKEAFYGCSKFSPSSLPNGLQQIDERGLYCNALFNRKEFVLPDSLEVMGNEAIYPLYSQKNKISRLPSRLKQIGKSVFVGCIDSSIPVFVLPANVKEIGQKSFENNHFQRLRIEPGIRTIPPRAFGGCFDLWHVEIEEGALKQIEKKAFEGCTSLLYLIVPDSVAVDPMAMSAPCQVIRRSEVPDDIAMLSELQRLQNGILSENSFARKCPFAFLLSDSIRPFEAEALVAMLRAGLLTDVNLMKRYWHILSLIEFPANQRTTLDLIQKNKKNIYSRQTDLLALGKYLDELLA